MPKFEINQRISIKGKPGVNGRINFIPPELRGKQFYEIKLDDGTIQSFHEHQLIEEIIATDPWQMFGSNQFESYRNFGLATTLFKVENTANNTISTLKASRTLFKAYQFKPLIKFLNSDNKRILIADEVGLGKTIEAGHIMLEFAGRNLMKNALIVCPKSLLIKWRTELSEKFHFEFKIYENTRDFAADIERDINLGRKSVMGIINYEKLRSRKNEGGEESNLFIKVLKSSAYSFDLLICDEAHKVRNHTTLQHKGVREIEKYAAAVVFLTATPIMTSIENLYHLINILDSRRYFNYELFVNAINLNKPFIRALNSLHQQKPLKYIANDLDKSHVKERYTIAQEQYSSDSTIREKFKDDKLYQRTMELLSSGEETYSIKAKVQQYLTDLNTLNHVYSRTRKKQVLKEDEYITRKAKHFTIELTPEEKKIYEDLNNEYEPGNLGLIQKKRQITSCIQGYITEESELNYGNYDKSFRDSKFEKFYNSIVQEVVVKNKKKLIVFAFFKKTLKYLEIRLEDNGVKCEIIHGDIKDRTERIENFRTTPQISILLSSEVGSEGLDLQFCDALVNYDLPWNPMVVEQRIGRIDRMGQESKVINVYSFALKGTIEEKIYNKLLQRINVFKESLGDLEDILGEDELLFKNIQKLETDLYSTKLTEKQQNERIDSVAIAIEQQKLDLQKLENELTDAIVNDLYFKDEINRIVKNNRYLTDTELIDYTESIVNNYLKTCLFKKVDENEYCVEVPQNNKGILLDFVEQYKDSTNTELEKIYRKFKVRFYDELKIKITFNQEYSFRNPSTEFISVYHPLINAITNYYKQKAYHINKAHQVGLSLKYFSDDHKPNVGHYIMVMYNIEVHKREYDKANKYHYVHACLVDVNGNEPQIISQEISDYVLGLASIHSQEPTETFEFTAEWLNIIRGPVINHIMENQISLEQDEKIRMDSTKHRRKELEEQFYSNKIKRYQTLLENPEYDEKIKRLWEVELKKTREEKEKRVQQIFESEIKVSHSIISVNHLHILN